MITIRPAQEKDFPEILSMIKGLAKFENAEEAVINSVEKMKAEQDYFFCLVAVNPNDDLIGMALYYHVYYTWVGKSMYLDDLYVKPEYRGKKVGSLLLKKIFEHAKRTNCNRLRWQVLDWNDPAIQMYTKAGANMDGEWINCDFDQNGINKYLES